MELGSKATTDPAGGILALFSDYVFLEFNGVVYSEVPWDRRFVDLFEGTISCIWLVGRMRRVSGPPGGHVVDPEYYTVVQMPDWTSIWAWLRSLPRGIRTILKVLRSADVVLVKLFYLNSVVAFAINWLAVHKPCGALLVGDAPVALMARDDIARSCTLRRAMSHLVAAVIRCILSKADVPSTVSDDLRRKYVPNRADVVVGNESWLDESMFEWRPRRSMDRPEHILFVGRLVRRKGVDRVIDAVAALVKEGFTLDLTVVGDGPMKSEVTAKASEAGIQHAVRFVGWVPSLSPELFAYYRRADILCLPSLAEGLPLVLIEAMANSCAVVASAVNGVPELVNNGRTGLLIEPGSTEALYQALKTLLQHPDLWRSCIARGFETAKLHTFSRQRAKLAKRLSEAMVTHR